MSHPLNRQEESMMTILATPSEIIVLNAAIRHYTQTAPHLAQAYQEAVPLLQQFQQRLVEKLGVPGKEDSR